MAIDMSVYPFTLGQQYSRDDIYEVLSVPEEKRRGNWETGYNVYDGDLFIFCNVGAAGRSGHDYDNQWLDDGRFQWFAKERTHVGQKQIHWMLNPTGNVLLFTRTDNRQPFTFAGFCEPSEHEATTPVKIVWKVNAAPTIKGPANLALANRLAIEDRFYVRKADPTGAYWFDFNKGRVRQYRDKWNDDFFLVIAGDEAIAGDYYCIPYKAVAHMLDETYIVQDEKGRARWIGDIRQHRLRISHCPIRLDLGQYYGVPLSTDIASDDESAENDYAIENRLAEVQQRVKQSVFRRRVVENFGGRCCICGISEPELLVASHVVPWSQRIDSRLDPANGLCLFVLYDSLFDAGYFTISEDLCVLIATDSGFSDALRDTLATIAGKQISASRIPLNAEYLMYHRAHVFRG